MNIYYLDTDPKKCAEYHCDRHVISQIKEYVYMLAVCNNKFRGRYDYEDLFPPVYKNHNCTRWVQESLSNYMVLSEICFHLSLEFKIRYGIANLYDDTINNLLVVPDMEDKGITDIMKLLPKEHQFPGDGVALNSLLGRVTLHRHFYLNEKSSIAQWRYATPKPYWYPEELLAHVMVDRDVDFLKYTMESVGLGPKIEKKK